MSVWRYRYVSVRFVNGTIARLVSTWKIVNKVTRTPLAFDKHTLWKRPKHLLLCSMRLCFGTQRWETRAVVGYPWHRCTRSRGTRVFLFTTCCIKQRFEHTPGSRAHTHLVICAAATWTFWGQRAWGCLHNASKHVFTRIRNKRWEAHMGKRTCFISIVITLLFYTPQWSAFAFLWWQWWKLGAWGSGGGGRDG